jgi:HK97 gp10 family phage protein
VASLSVKVTSNDLAAVAEEIVSLSGQVLDDLGQVFHSTAYDECPVSNIDEPGYVHLRDTIGYQISQPDTIGQQEVTFYATKDYAEFVNDGTSTMEPRPFFTDGLLAVEDKIDDIVRARYRNMMLGTAKSSQNIGSQ